MIILFVLAGVMYSGEYDVCDVTLSVHPHRESWKDWVSSFNISLQILLNLEFTHAKFPTVITETLTV
jgi:hypothetical protein